VATESEPRQYCANTKVYNVVPVGTSHESAKRNFLLRSIDWRFLATPQPACAWGTGTIKTAIALIAATRSDGYEVVGVPHSRANLMPDAIRNLRAGGWLYVEWGRFKRQRSVRRQLKRFGMEQVQFYRPWPSLHAAEAWVPLGSPGARSYFMARQFPPVTDITSAARRARRWASVGAWLLGLRAPFVTLAQKGKTDDQNREHIAAFVARNWHSWTATVPPASVSFILLTGGRRSFNKVVALVFPDHHPVPQIAIKFPRESDAVPSLTREAAVLSELRRRVDDRLTGYPHVLFAEQWSGSFAVVQSAIGGRPVNSMAHSSTYLATAQKGTQWLIDLALHSSNGDSSTGWRRVSEAALNRFDNLLAGTAAEQVETVRTAMSSIGPLPHVIEQRDFAPWNLLIDDHGRLGVLDWESAECAGLPYLDLIYFLTMLAFQHAEVPVHHRTLKTAEYYVSLSSGDDHVGQERRNLLLEYGRRLGLASENINSLSMLCWVIHCTSEIENFVRDDGPGDAQRHLDKSVFFCLLNEEVALFRSRQKRSPVM
jgi:Phosphotransferase enzyme family